MDDRRRGRQILVYIAFAALLVLGILNFDKLLTVLGMLWRIALPLIIGLVIAYILNIVMRLPEKIYFPKSSHPLVQKTRKPVCLLLAILLILGILAFVVAMVVPELEKAIGVITASLPDAFGGLKEWFATHDGMFPEIAEFVGAMEMDFSSISKKVLDFAGSGIGGVLDSTFSIIGSVTTGVVDGFVAIVFALYTVLSKERLKAQAGMLLRRYVQPRRVKRIRHIAAVAHDTFTNFIVGQCTEAVILGVLCALGMMLFRFPYALMVGTLVGVTALIPLLGAYLGAGVGAFVIMTVNPMQALGFLAFILILQQLEGNLIYPRTVGASIGLPGMWVMAAITIGGGLGGVAGMLMGVPTAATLYKLLAEDVHTGPQETDEDEPIWPEEVPEQEKKAPAVEAKRSDKPANRNVRRGRK